MDKIGKYAAQSPHFGTPNKHLEAQISQKAGSELQAKGSLADSKKFLCIFVTEVPANIQYKELKSQLFI